MNLKDMIAKYIEINCELLTMPRCSNCGDKDKEVYYDSGSGDDFCRPCLEKDLLKDPDYLISETEEKSK